MISPESVRTPYPDLAGLTILVVEDHQDSRELLTALLEHRRAHVVSAETASAAFELVQRHQPNVIVSDIGLPGEDGLSLIRRIRDLPALGGGAIPAIALTALSSDEDRRRALGGGFQAYFKKPIEIEPLLQAVAAMASARSSRD